MLKDVINQELHTLEIDASELAELGENMAAGVGCKGASCSGSCSGNGTH